MFCDVDQFPAKKHAKPDQTRLELCRKYPLRALFSLVRDSLPFKIAKIARSVFTPEYDPGIRGTEVRQVCCVAGLNNLSRRGKAWETGTNHR